MFDNELILSGLAMLMVNLALRAGSSQQGNALLASIAWNWVTAIHLKKSFLILRYSQGRILESFG